MSRTGVVAMCGVGGCGKTTIAAAYAVAAARAGRRAVVLTIDPARRLADALGIDSLGNVPRPVPLDGLDAAGTLHALMLDRKATFDDLVRRHAGDAATAERLLENRYYRAVSTRLTGAHEYMATEKLHQIVDSGEWDVVVLDTPPAQHAIEFFRAPERVGRLFEEGTLARLSASGGGLWSGVARRAASVIDRLAGASVLEDIREFFRLASGLSGALRERNAAVYTLLRSDRTRFRLVTSPQADQTDEVESFARVLRDEQMALHGLVVNRVVAMPRLGRPIAADRLPRPDGLGDADWDRTAAVLGALPERVATIARRHADAIAALSAAAGGAPVAVVPDRAGGIRSLDGLASIGPFLGR